MIEDLGYKIKPRLFSFILAIGLFFAVFNCASAAKEVQGTVPVLPPLQPAPSGIYPNYSGSVQYESQDIAPQATDTPGQGGENSQAGAGDIARESGGDKSGQAQAQAPVLSLAGGRALVKNILFGILVVVLIAGGAYYIKRGKE